MKTINRQNASNKPTRIQVEALSRVARMLWSTNPPVEPQLRESLLVELTWVESDLERLRIRSVIGEIRAQDSGELDSCAERLAELERRWQPETSSPLLPEGTAP